METEQNCLKAEASEVDLGIVRSGDGIDGGGREGGGDGGSAKDGDEDGVRLSQGSANTGAEVLGGAVPDLNAVGDNMAEEGEDVAVFGQFVQVGCGASFVGLLSLGCYGVVRIVRNHPHPRRVNYWCLQILGRCG